MVSPRSCVFVAAVKDDVVGYLTGSISRAKLYRSIKEYAELESMFVLEGFRDLKIGSRLVLAFISWCKQCRIKRIHVEASAENRKAIGFYKKFGLKEYSCVLEMDI